MSQLMSQVLHIRRRLDTLGRRTRPGGPGRANVFAASHPLRAVPAISLALVGPLVVTTAWIPIRERLPNADLALILVIAAGAVGALGRRSATLVAAVSAAFWFEFFDTVPYDRLAIARNPDIETTLVVAVVTAIVGELVMRTVRHRRSLHAESEELVCLRNAAELVASGEELVAVIDAVAHELKQLLRLESCRFESPDESRSIATVNRDGQILASAPAIVGSEAGGCVGLPVVVQGQTLGQFTLGMDGRSDSTRERLLVALALADQVGAAFLAQAPPPLPPGVSEPLRGLRVVGAIGNGRALRGSGSAHETAGLSSAEERMIS